MYSVYSRKQKSVILKINSVNCLYTFIKYLSLLQKAVTKWKRPWSWAASRGALRHWTGGCSLHCSHTSEQQLQCGGRETSTMRQFFPPFPLQVLHPFSFPSPSSFSHPYFSFPSPPLSHTSSSFSLTYPSSSFSLSHFFFLLSHIPFLFPLSLTHNFCLLCSRSLSKYVNTSTYIRFTTSCSYSQNSPS